MSKELLKQALDALMRMDKQSPYPVEPRLINAIRAALAVPAPEPVGYVYSENMKGFVTRHAAVQRDLPNGTALYAAPQPAPAVPISWDRLRILMDGIPTREEFIGGQRQQYVAKEAVMGWLYEGQLRAEREAAQSAAPAVREPLSDEQIGRISYFCADARGPRVDQFKFARDIERAHGIGGSND